MGVMAILTQGCNDTSFSIASMPLIDNQDLTPDPDDKEPPICDPFSNGGAAEAKNGIRGTLHYYEVGDPLISSIRNSTHFMSGVPGVVDAPSAVYLNQLDVPTRAFDQGFTSGDGQLLRTMSGDPLIEWFSLRMASNLVAPTVSEEGDYQFAMHSDDGALLKIDENRDGNFEVLVDDDTIHSPHLKCATRTVHLKAGDPLPMKLDYFQGPRVLITMQLLWRRMPAAQNSGMSCAMNELSAVPAKAFELEAGRKNPCAK